MRVIATVGAVLLVAAPAFAQPAFYNATYNFQPSQGEALPFSPYWPGVKSPDRSEQALRHQIEAIETGQPDYAAMTPKTANQLRSQIDKIHPSLVRQWGAFVSLHRRPTLDGNYYEAKFERARVRWEIRMNPEGQIAGIAFKTLS